MRYRPSYGPGTVTRHYGRYAYGDTATLRITPPDPTLPSPFTLYPVYDIAIHPELPSLSYVGRTVSGPFAAIRALRYILAIIGPEQFRVVTEYTEVYPCP